jgi:predicted transcriptional regulator
MGTLTLRLPDDTHDRLRQLAQRRKVSLDRLLEELSTAAIAELDAETRFRARAATGSPETVDRFREENVSHNDARAWLATTLPGTDGTGEPTAALALAAARRSLAKQRQQLLATMVLMGVNRAVDCD